MTAHFSVQQDGVVLNRYTAPLTADDIQGMTRQDNDYAAQFGQPIIVIADFGAIKSYPASLITLGIRHDDSNPIRSARVRSIVVITNVAIMERMAAIVSSVVKNEKFVVVHDWDRALQEVNRLLIPA